MISIYEKLTYEEYKRRLEDRVRGAGLEEFVDYKILSEQEFKPNNRLGEEYLNLQSGKYLVDKNLLFKEKFITLLGGIELLFIGNGKLNFHSCNIETSGGNLEFNSLNAYDPTINLLNCATEIGFINASNVNLYQAGGNIYLGNSVFSSHLFISEAEANLKDLTIKDNKNKPGLYVTESKLTADNLLVKSNSQKGIELRNSDSTIKNTTISNNLSKEHGAGMLVIGGKLILQDSKIRDNVSSRFGGGIFLDCYDPLIINTEFTNNSAKKYGGIYYKGKNKKEFFDKLNLFNIIKNNNPEDTNL